MQLQIDFIGKRTVILLMQALPGIFESVETLSAALRAGPVSGGKCDRFIEEKQFGITSLGHHGPMPASEFQNARNPTPAFEPALYLPVAVVQGAAPVSHHCPASGSPKNVAEGIYSVLQWHLFPQG